MTDSENEIPDLIEPATTSWGTATSSQIVADLRAAIERAARGDWKI